ncbi:MAG: GAF domain-containing protein [Acidobacteria bacterium]|nr:GAF domain-containing protein [Acidobacteriota bacterium]
MSVPLESLATCFQGLLPAELFTCSLDGVPNAAYLSHVDYVDSTHVALSFQFFNKSRRNIAENPKALILLPDPDTGQVWRLRLRYVRSETEGPLFERMRLRIEAIASYCGLKGIFRLRASDVYEVLSVEPSAEQAGTDGPGTTQRRTGRPEGDPVFTMQALQDFATRLHSADSLEGLLDSILAALDESFGFRHSMILMPTEVEGELMTIASRGYPEGGVGSESRHGEGLAGLVAEARQPIRISGLMRGILYALAMHHESTDPGKMIIGRKIPVPGLAHPESQLGIPLLVRGELVGVLCLESEVPYRFHEEDKRSIEVLGSYVAIAIQNMQLHERSVADSTAESAASHAVAAGPSGPAPLPGRHDIVYYQSDECLLVDGEYLIRSLPAKILWKLLTAHRDTGKTEFTNRELRLDKSLNLPEWKDNLESRLLLLRRRLEQKCPTIRISPRARGRFALELCRDVDLSTRP